MKCKKCNSELIEYKVGDKTEYICPVCDEAPATQIDNLIEFDSNKYTIKILTSKEHDKDVLKEIAQICGCNMLDAKKIIEVTGFEFKPMDALETRALKRKIERAGISYSISPEFRWQ
jgi:large subunit ribosomal protein L7/L12